jgi:hypothetical protein
MADADDPVTRLIDRLRAGDHDAAERLWRRYFPRLVRLARAHLRGSPCRAADEEDVALGAFDSFCRGVEAGRFPRLTGRDALWDLLVTIALRHAAEWRQHETRQKRGGADGAGGAGGASRAPARRAAPRFAVRAADKAELARKRVAETAVALGRAEEALADGLLRPLGIEDKKEVNVFEWQALADLTSLPSEQARVRPLFAELALGNERKAGQLGRRLKPALQAAVGTSRETRQRIIDLAERAVRDESRQALELVPKADWLQPREWSDALAAGAEEGDHETTRAAAAAAARRALELASTTETMSRFPHLRDSVAAVMAVAGRMDRETATAVARRALQLVPKANADHLSELSKLVAAVAEKGEPESTHAAATAIARRALELLPGDDLHTLILTLHAVHDRIEPTPQPEAVAQHGRQLLLHAFLYDDEKKALPAILDRLLRGASDEALLDLLKHPACVGLTREAVLRELGRQHERYFRSVWDAVDWLQQHRPDLDLNSPPRIARDPPPGR